MRLLFLLSAFLFSLSIQAQSTPKAVDSKIEKVTVFFDGAQVTRICSVTLEQGKNSILLKGLSPNINRQSIQVDPGSGVSINSVEYQYNYMESIKNTDEINNLIEKQKKLKEGIIEQQYLQGVYSQEFEMLRANQSIRGETNGVKVEELKAAVEFYRTRLLDLNQKQTELKVRIKELTEQFAKINDQLSQLKVKDDGPSGEILLTLNSKTAKTAEIKVSYFMSNAGWKPTYDLKMNDIQLPLTLVRKAMVHQSTGEKWDKVNLVLSTGSPSQAIQKPLLFPWYLGQSPPVKKTDNSYISDNPYAGTGTLKGKVLDKSTREPIPFANIVVEVQGTMTGGSTSDFDGNVTIKPLTAGKYNVKVSYIGYKSLMIQGVIINSDKITFMDFDLESTGVSLEAVTVVDYKVPLISKDKVSSGGTVTADEIRRMPSRSADNTATTVGGVFSADGERGSVRGSRSEGTVMYVDGMKVRGSNYLPESDREDVYYDKSTGNYASKGSTSAKVADINTLQQSDFEYIIETPYTINADGKELSVSIEEKLVQATYEYQCVPKMDKNAYVIARITRWEDYQLVPGEVFLYFEGVYTGKTFLDISSARDTLELSLGKDPSIIVERKKVTDKSSTGFFGNNRKLERTWDLTVRNNKKTSINLTIEDQYPLCRDSDVKIELLESSNAIVDEKTASLKWKLTLAPAQLQKLTFSYSIKSPTWFKYWIE